MSANPAIEFLLWLLIAASVIGVVSNRLRIPYTVALVLGGLFLGSVHLPMIEALSAGRRPDWLTPEVILIFFLPALLFEGSLKIQFRHFRENIVSILLLANVGVLIAAVITGYAVHWLVGLPLLVAMLFGAMISATDPISVLAIFKNMPVPKRLAIIIESESLFNDGTAVVLFQILLAGIATGDLNVATGVGRFLAAVIGGAALGFAFGYIASKATARIDDPQIEITLTTIVAYGSYLLGHSLHVSGVIATVVAGLTVGNIATKEGMSPRTRVALWSFWEYVSFVFNSLIFLLIGMEVRIGSLFREWKALLLAFAAVIVGRALAVYSLAPLSDIFSAKAPKRWQHLLVWGGMHGSLSLALVLSLSPDFPERETLLVLTFGVVALSIVGQGLTIQGLIRFLGIATSEEHEYDRTRVRHKAITTAIRELEKMLNEQSISQPVYQELKAELDTKFVKSADELKSLRASGGTRADEEMQAARHRIVTAQKSAIEEAVHDGHISAQTAGKLLDAVDEEETERKLKVEGDKGQEAPA